MIRILKKFSVLALIVVTATTLSGCRFVDKETREAMQPVVLEYWRVFDNDQAFDQVLAQYQRLHPHISINYRKLRFDEYEQELLDAFAEDRGPDIFSIHNTWMKKYQSKLEPLPPRITLPYQIEQGTIKKEIITKLKTDPTISMDQVREEFVPVVASDVIMKSVPEPGSNEGPRNEIYGLPLSVDTMVMYYNRDLLNRFGVVSPPQTWKQYQEAVKKIISVDKDNNILQAAAPFGTSNVERSFDIISLLMLQNGTQMFDSRGNVTLDKIPATLNTEEPPASQALRFYTDFGNPTKEVYTWNEDMEDGLQQFVAGDLPFFFGYSYHLPIIQTNAPNQNIGISYMPQIGNNPAVNYANYWVEVVSRKTEHVDESWDFIQFITDAENVSSYLSNVVKPTATTTLINEQIEDLNLGVFAEQLMSAQSWYTGMDIEAAERVFDEMIDEVHATRQEGVDYDILVTRAAQKVSQTLK